jgi:hypothetical protein
MSNRTNVPRIIAVVAVLLATSAKAQTALARPDCSNSPRLLSTSQSFAIKGPLS